MYYYSHIVAPSTCQNARNLKNLISEKYEYILYIQVLDAEGPTDTVYSKYFILLILVTILEHLSTSQCFGARAFMDGAGKEILGGLRLLLYD